MFFKVCFFPFLLSFISFSIIEESSSGLPVEEFELKATNNVGSTVHLFKWTPREVGRYTMVAYAGQQRHLKSEQLQFSVYDANAVVLIGPDQVAVNVGAKFSIDCRRAGLGDLEVYVVYASEEASQRGLTSSPIPNLITPKSRVQFELEFTPECPGEIVINIAFNGRDIGCSPFTVVATDTPQITINSKLICEGEKDIVFPSFVNEELPLVIDPKGFNQYDYKVGIFNLNKEDDARKLSKIQQLEDFDQVQGGILIDLKQSHSNVKNNTLSSVTDEKYGKILTCSFVATQQGIYQAILFYGNRPIRSSSNSSFLYYVFDPKQIFIYGRGPQPTMAKELTTVDVDLQKLTVNCAKLFYDIANCEVLYYPNKILVHDTDYTPEQVEFDLNISESSDKLMTLDFLPLETGLYKVSIKIGDRHCTGSPFDFTVEERGYSLQVKGPGYEQAFLNEETYFTLESTAIRALPDDLSAIVTNSIDESLPLRFLFDLPNKWFVFYRPTSVGVHELRIIERRSRMNQGSNAPYETLVLPKRVSVVDIDALQIAQVPGEEPCAGEELVFTC